MNYNDALKTLREPLAEMSWFDNLRLPFGKYTGTRLADLYDKDKDYFRWFKDLWLSRNVSKDDEVYDREITFAQGLVVIWNEHCYADKYSSEYERRYAT